MAFINYCRRCFLVVFSAIVAWVNLIVDAELDQDSEWYEDNFDKWLSWYRSDFFDAINGKWGIDLHFPWIN